MGVASRYARGHEASTSPVTTDVVCAYCTLSACAVRTDELAFILTLCFSDRKISNFIFLKGHGTVGVSWERCASNI